jgi:hypothetical protein
MSGPRRVARGRAAPLLVLVACAPTVSQRPPDSSKQSRPAVSSAAVVPAVSTHAPTRVSVPPPTPPPRPPPPPPPVVDAEQRAILDALEVVARTLETPHPPKELAQALGTIVPSTADPREEDATYWIEVKPLDAAFRRIRVGIHRSPTAGGVEVTVRTPTSAVILGTQFGVLIEAGLVPEFDDPYWLVTCRQLPDGASVSIEVMFDWKPKLGAAEPTSTVYLQRLPDGGCW